MANKALVVSEPIYRPAPYEPGRHYVSCSADEMPDVISHYLDNDDERACIVDEAYRLVSQEVTLKLSVARILNPLRQQMALVVDARNRSSER